MLELNEAVWDCHFRTNCRVKRHLISTPSRQHGSPAEKNLTERFIRSDKNGLHPSRPTLDRRLARPQKATFTQNSVSIWLSKEYQKGFTL